MLLAKTGIYEIMCFGVQTLPIHIYIDIIKSSVGESTKTYLGFDTQGNKMSANKIEVYMTENNCTEAGDERLQMLLNAMINTLQPKLG